MADTIYDELFGEAIKRQRKPRLLEIIKILASKKKRDAYILTPVWSCEDGAESEECNTIAELIKEKHDLSKELKIKNKLSNFEKKYLLERAINELSRN